MNAIKDPFAEIKKVTLAPFIFIGEITILLIEGIRRLFKRPVEVNETINQMGFIGVSSLTIVAITIFASGAVMALYIAPLFRQSGGADLVGATVGLVITRELGPVIAGIMVAARCGSAMAAQIGSMAVTEQLDALKSLNVHPYNYLLVPRLIASVIMLPMLSLFGVFAGMYGALIVAQINGISSSQFLRSVEVYLDSWDFLGGLYKTIFFGLIIALVSCQQGLRTKGGAVGVGKATTNAVVISVVLIYISNYFLAAWFY